MAGAHIIVEKVTNPTGSSQEFTFHPSWGGDFTLVDGQSNDSGLLDPGTYSISEDPVIDWTTIVSVSNGDPPDAIVIAEGGTGANPIQEAAGVGSASFAAPTQAGSSILVLTASNDGSSTKAPTDDQGNEYNQIQSGFWTNGNNVATIWYAPASTFTNTAGVTTVTALIDVGTDSFVWIMEVTTLQDAGNAPNDFDSGNFGGPDSAPVGSDIGVIGTGSNEPNPAGDICVAVAVVGPSATVTSVDAPWTLGTVQGGNAIAWAFGNNGDENPIPQFHTDVNSSWAIAQGCFLAAGGTPATPDVTVTFTNSLQLKPFFLRSYNLKGTPFNTL